jgi:hypothetical protein
MIQPDPDLHVADPVTLTPEEAASLDTLTAAGAVGIMDVTAEPEPEPEAGI